MKILKKYYLLLVGKILLFSELQLWWCLKFCPNDWLKKKMQVCSVIKTEEQIHIEYEVLVIYMTTNPLIVMVRKLYRTFSWKRWLSIKLNKHPYRNLTKMRRMSLTTFCRIFFQKRKKKPFCRIFIRKHPYTKENGWSTKIKQAPISKFY